MMASNKKPKRVRSEDFRFVVGETFNLTINDNGGKIIFGIESGEEEVFEQIGVFLTLRSLKILSFILQKGINNIEENMGQEIPIDSAKTEELKKVFADAFRKKDK